MKSYGIFLFCCLFYFVISEHYHLKEHPKYVQNRKSEPETVGNCSWICGVEPLQGGLTIFYKSSIVAALNTTSNLAIIISKNHTLLLNGNNGIGAINKTSEQFFKVSEIWFASKTKFEAFFEKVDDAFLEKISLKATEKIDVNQFWPNARDSLQIITKSSLNLHLSILYREQGSFKITHDLKWFVSVNSALITFIQSSPQLTKTVQSTKLDLKTIFQAKSGLELLINFLQQIGGNVNLVTVVPQLLSNPQRLLRIAQQLSGGSTQGLDGWINIILEILDIIQGHGSVENIFSAVVNYQQLGDTNLGELKIIYKKVQQLVQLQDRKYHNATALKGFLQFFKLLSEGTVIFDNVNISEYLKLIPKGPIGFVTKILENYGGSLGKKHGIPDFFNTIISSLNTTGNSQVLHNLLPGLDPNVLSQLSKNGSLLGQALHGFNISNIFRQNGDIENQLKKIPILGSIVGQISQGLGGSANLQQFLNSSSIEQTLENAIKTWTSGGGFFTSFATILPELGHGIESIFSGGFLGNNRHGIAHQNPNSHQKQSN